jgi:hypothetical protein
MISCEPSCVPTAAFAIEWQHSGLPIRRTSTAPLRGKSSVSGSRYVAIAYQDEGDHDMGRNG